MPKKPAPSPAPAPAPPAAIARTTPAPLSIPQATRARFGFGTFSAEAEMAVTPAGMLAFGGLVSMILLSVTPIVLAARKRKSTPPAPPAA
jgi:hypothetical protein